MIFRNLEEKLLHMANDAWTTKSCYYKQIEYSLLVMSIYILAYTGSICACVFTTI